MAPTGRAAKRLAISSGREPDTIHKALEASVRETAGHTSKEMKPIRWKKI